VNNLDVRIVKLDPMRVAAAHGFGAGPEPIAWDKLKAYMQYTHLMEDGQTHRFFGFNNPEPSPGSPNYGYEQWVTVGPDAQPEGEIQVKEFEGGLYAVTKTNLAEIGQTWQALFAWRERSPYHFGSQQWLEEVMTWDPIRTHDEMGPENVWIDLYMPIAE
jgi:DNA gyrase inhibitor GyrI